jgi:TatD DNase family protein
MMFDSHCHLHDERIGARAPELIARARAAGVTGFLLAGVAPDGWAIEEALAREHADVYVALGVHPQLVDEVDDAEARRLCDALPVALDDPARARPAAIGEIGLDGMGTRKATLPRQETAFRVQLAEARARELPVVLHILHAHGPALALLRRDGVPRAGGVMHSYSGPADLVRDYAALGLSFSFAGPVTNEAAKRTHAAARAVPLERLLAETDAPFQTPFVDGARPLENEPAFLVAIVEALAQIRGESRAAVAQATDDNARRLFGITR